MFYGSKQRNNGVVVGLIVGVTVLAIVTVGRPALFPSEAEKRRANALRAELAAFQADQARLRDADRRSASDS
ncbi:hypothetical protein BC830DRAFT_1165117 [Chytriomyces sp. MP71]|nr:hypothetical protein BC830DRAFT_1165117 [Chytriomyces sp. MP71]